MSRANDSMVLEDLLAIMTKKLEEFKIQFDKKFEKLGNILDHMEEKALNTNQRHAGLQHQAHQPSLAMKADVQGDKKTRESTEDFTQDGILGDISSDRVHDPMRLTSFGDKDYTEPPALPSRDDALVNQGHEVAKPCLSTVEIRKSTSADSLQRTGATSTTKTQGTNFPPQLLPRSFRETSEEKKISTTRQTFAKYNRSWHPKVIEKRSRQNMVFDPGGLSGCLCGCPFWEGDARCIVGGSIREAFAIPYNYLCFSRFQYAKNYPRVI